MRACGGDFEKAKNIKLSWADASHQNETAECAINTVVTMTRYMPTNVAMIYPKVTLPLISGQVKCIILYGVKGKGLIKCQKP